MRQSVDKDAVMRLAASGVSRTTIAERFGVSISRVCQIISGKPGRVARAAEKAAREAAKAAREAEKAWIKAEAEEQKAAEVAAIKAAREAAKAEQVASRRAAAVAARAVAPVQLVVRPAAPPPAPPHPIIETAGRYAALADYAARHGLTHAQALQLWHKERLRPGSRVQRGAA